MSDYMEITAVTSYTDRDGNQKNQFTRIGTAWPMKNGGYRLSFNALPVPSLNDKGVIETVALALPPKPKDNQQQSRGGGRSQGNADDIPWAPEWR